MGIAETLMSLLGKDKKPRRIESDGKVYTFTPGEGGSLIADKKEKAKK